MRVNFCRGMQRKFLQKVLENSGCPSLRSLIERGFDIPYSTLKSYFNENRTLPEDLFKQLCFIGKMDSDDLKPEILKEYWGQIKGGKKVLDE